MSFEKRSSSGKKFAKFTCLLEKESIGHKFRQEVKQYNLSS